MGLAQYELLMIYKTTVFFEVSFPLKTMHLTKSLLNLMSCSLDFWQLCTCTSCSFDFFTRMSEVLIFCTWLIKSWSPDLFVCFYKTPFIWTPKNLNFNMLALRTLWGLWYHNQRSQNVLGLQRKMLVSSSHKISHLPFTTPNTELFHSYRHCTRKNLHCQLIMEPLLG